MQAGSKYRREGQISYLTILCPHIIILVFARAKSAEYIDDGGFRIVCD